MEYCGLPAKGSGVTAFIAFIRLSRLKFLLGGLLGVALGAAMAYHRWHILNWGIVAWAQLSVTAFQLMTHYSNDYFDRDTDAISTRTPFSGGSGVFARNELAPRVAIFAALACAAIGLVPATLFLMHGNVLAGGLGVAIMILAWDYSAPPVHLHSRGVGEVTTALVVAVLVPLFAYAALMHAVDPLAVLSTLPAASAMFVMMLCVEIPDLAVDSATGKRNLLVRLGRQSAPTLVSGATTAIALSAFLAIRAGAPRGLLGVALLAMLLCTWLRVRLNRDEQPADAWIARTGVIIFLVTLAASVAAYLVP